MHDFILKEIKNTDLEKEIINIGYDVIYAHKAVDKFQYKNYKIFNVNVAQANIIKQLALSVGADCATHRDVITGHADLTDCILGGSISQLNKVSQKLLMQPFGLKYLGEQISGLLKDKKQYFGTKIVGILNLTPDSFSDGGQYADYDCAIKHMDEMILDGAGIIDIGAESTRPNSTDVEPDMQLKRLIPVVKYAKEKGYTISIDTRSSKVAEECLRLGADIINDVSGFDYDSDMPNIIAKYNAKVIIQHSKGSPSDMQNNPQYANLTDEIYLSLKDKANRAIECGVKKENIIIDPGIGFGKSREHNFELINRIEEFYPLGYPVMLGVSRKSLLNMQDADNNTKDIYTAALNAIIINKKVDYIRVHNVKIHKTLIDMLSI